MSIDIKRSREQQDIITKLGSNNVLVDSVAGSGKCHAYNTPIIMYDGSIKMVQDVVVGDCLMGDDSTPRRVLSLGRGRDVMYEVVSEFSDNYTFNSEHILSLKYVDFGIKCKDKQWEVRWFCTKNNKLSFKKSKFSSKVDAELYLSKLGSNVLDISIKSYLTLPDKYRYRLHIYKNSIEFNESKVKYDPYRLGLLIAFIVSGNESPTKNHLEDIGEILDEMQEGITEKFTSCMNEELIEYMEQSNRFSTLDKIYRRVVVMYLISVIKNYKINSLEIRRNLIYGIFKYSSTFNIDSKDEVYNILINDIVYIINSLGLLTNTTNDSKLYILKNLTSSFKLVKQKEDNYYGFELDGNHRYVMGDFTVTHNTSTIIFIAEEYKNDNILVLTYNSSLKFETRKRTSKYTNVRVDSYHSFCVKNYDNTAHIDSRVDSIITNDTKPLTTFNYSIIIADEAQDLTPLLHRLLCKIMKDNEGKEVCRFLVMGDHMQNIYDFMDSDSRFLTMAPKLYTNNFEWVQLRLSETFRCTIPIVNFINNCMIGYERVVSNKKSSVYTKYVICDPYIKRSCEYSPINIVTEALQRYKPSDIFILSPSVKNSGSPIRHLERYVTEYLNIPIYCSGSDNDQIDSRVIDNKLVFTTIHQSKGHERKHVILFNFDDSYYKYYDNTKQQHICPNMLYVAATRASESLVVVHGSNNNFLPFLKVKKLKKCSEIIITNKNKSIPPKKNEVPKDTILGVTELLGYLPYSIEKLCLEQFDVTTIRNASSVLRIPTVISTKLMMMNTYDNLNVIPEIYESVSDINGVALTTYYEYKKTGRSVLFGKNLVTEKIVRIQNSNLSEDSKIHMITPLKTTSKVLESYYNTYIRDLDPDNLSTCDITKISNFYCSQKNMSDYKLKQVTRFDWISNSIFEDSYKRLSSVVMGEDVCFEESYSAVYEGITVIGEIDCVTHDKEEVFEFKCTSCLNDIHKIQLAVYKWMCVSNNAEYDKFRYYLYNILTNELVEISSSMDRLNTMMKILLEYRVRSNKSIEDDEFIKVHSLL